MNKNLSIVTCLIALVVMMASGATHAATPGLKLYMSPSSASMTVGKTKSVQVRLAKNTSSRVDYVNAHLSFPTSKLSVVSISNSGSHFSDNGGPSSSFSNSQGTITISGTGPSLSTPDDVHIATIMFKAKSSGSTSVNFTNSSQAGDMVGGGNVKNYLDATSGAALSITTSPDSSVTSTSVPSGSANSTIQTSTQATSKQPAPSAAEPVLITSSDETSVTATSQPTPEEDQTDASTPLSSHLASYTLPTVSIVGTVIAGVLLWNSLRRRHHRAIKQDEQHLFHNDTVASSPTGPAMAQTIATTPSELKRIKPTVAHEAVIQPASTAATQATSVSPQTPATAASTANTNDTVLTPQATPAPPAQSPAGPKLVPAPPVSATASNGEPLDMFEMGDQRLTNEGYRQK